MKEIAQVPDCSKCRNVKNGDSILTDCPVKELENKFRDKKFLQFEKGEHLYKMNESVKGIYCIYSGKVRIYTPGKNEKEITIHCPSAGEIIGFNSIREGKYTNSAIATEETHACLFPLSEVQQLIKTLSTVTQKIIGNKC
ncbi:MAG: cyclic nucleotide-binding domain-containing protein [Bacteroidetes bacterium]|nr:cyclic nucleotide-binding domain-containing protein [Bacteroidota bacterium]